MRAGYPLQFSVFNFSIPLPRTPLARFRRHAAALLLLSFCAANAWAASSAQAQDEAFAQFVRAQKGDEQAIDSAARQYAALLSADPGNPALMAYAGAAGAMRARTALFPWKKMSYAEDGMALIDKALRQLSPAHEAAFYRGTSLVLETKFVAANTFLNMPASFNRQPQGARLLRELLDDAQLPNAPAAFRAALWMRGARLAQQENRIEDARRLLRRVADSGAPQAALAQARLNEDALR